VVGMSQSALPLDSFVVCGHGQSNVVVGGRHDEPAAKGGLGK
jgi:hypothetical protein